MDEALSKIRSQVNAGTPAVKRPAVLLVAVESTLSSQSTGLAASAYYVALLSTLNAQLEKEGKDEQLLEATLYLFSVLAPFVPAQAWKTNQFPDLLVLFEHFAESAPTLKSLITIASHLPPGQLDPKVYSALLQLTKDSRPKLRKKAQEAVKQVLQRPKAPSRVHAFEKETCDWVAREAAAAVKDAKKGVTGADSRAIAMFTFAKNLGTNWSSASTAAVLPTILSALTLSSPHLSLAALALLSHFFSASLEAEMEEGTVEDTLEALLKGRPRSEGEQGEKLLAGWCEGVGEGCVALARKSPQKALQQAVTILPSILPILTDARSPSLLAAVSHCSTVLVSHCLPADDFALAQPIVKLIRTSLESPMYSGPALPHLLATVKALFLRYRLRVKGKPLACKMTSFMPILDRLRDTEWRKDVEEVLATATTVCGPEWVLQQLPLDLDSGKKGRAWLLPLFKGCITNTSLAHFKSYFMPLSSTFFDRAKAARDSSKDMEAKIWDTLLTQVFALLPGYCTHPIDPESFDADFLASLAAIVYATPQLRPPIFRSFEVILSSAQTQANASAPPEVLAQFGLKSSPEPLRKLSGLAKDVLGLAFNVYGSTRRGGGSFILTTVTAWAGALSDQDAQSTIASIKTLLAQAIGAAQEAAAKNTEDDIVRPVHALLDILLALAPSIKTVDVCRSLWDMALDDKLRSNADIGVQKKAYRLAARVLEEQPQVAAGQVGSLMELLEEGTTAARKEQTYLLELLVPLLPNDELHHIPSLIPTVVLGTKEANGQTRQASFDLMLKLAAKMNEGGTLDRNKVKGMEEGMEEPVKSSISEFILMVSAGLAGEDPHMISATILCLARLVWDYHEQLSTEMLDELAKTMTVFLASPNREIVRSAIGFVKVVVVGLPSSILAPHLAELMPALITWSHEHSNHFKVKVRHLIERLIRKYGVKAVESATPAADRKLVQNVRKRMMRAKKKKAAREGSDDEEDAADVPKPQAPTRSAYDEVLYGGSDSEASVDGDSDVEDEQPVHNRKSAKRRREKEDKKNGVFVREEEGEVLDLLDGDMMSRVTSSRQPKNARSKGDERSSLSSKFKTDEDGRFRFEEDDGAAADELPVGESGMGAYIEAMRGEDGHTRDARGRVKFNKRRRGADGEDEGDDTVTEGLRGLDVAGGDKRKKAKREGGGRQKIGEEFKAKRAGGDVKKNNVQPYAYVPLSTVGGKKKGRSGGKELDITGKRSRKGKH